MAGQPTTGEKVSPADLALMRRVFPEIKVCRWRFSREASASETLGSYPGSSSKIKVKMVQAEGTGISRCVWATRHGDGRAEVRKGR